MARTTTPHTGIRSSVRQLAGLGLLCSALLAGCGTARMVNRTQYGGVIALEGNDRNAAMDKAHEQMAAHCGPGQYTILREGETVVGQDQVARSDTYEERDGESQTASSSTRDATEWRVEYQCNNAPPAPAPQPEPYPEQGGEQGGEPYPEGPPPPSPGT